MSAIINLKKSIDASSVLNSMVVVGIFIATAYWALDTIMHLFFSDRFNLIAQMIGPDLYDTYIRIIVLCLFVIPPEKGSDILCRHSSKCRFLPHSQVNAQRLRLEIFFICLS